MGFRPFLLRWLGGMKRLEAVVGALWVVPVLRVVKRGWICVRVWSIGRC